MKRKKKTKISINDFTFFASGYGSYRVTYISPITGKGWIKIISNMRLIDATKNADEPRIKDLERLKRIVKQ